MSDKKIPTSFAELFSVPHNLDTAIAFPHGMEIPRMDFPWINSLAGAPALASAPDFSWLSQFALQGPLHEEAARIVAMIQESIAGLEMFAQFIHAFVAADCQTFPSGAIAGEILRAMQMPVDDRPTIEAPEVEM
jgi:hypothetical protein